MILFINKFFKGEIKLFFEKRLFYISDYSEFLETEIQNAIKADKSWEILKILIEHKEKILNFENKYKINLNIFEKNIIILYNNIIRFNSHEILIGHIINSMKIIYSIPFIYILNIDEISFKKYIQSYHVKDCLKYSKWADYLENDFKILDNLIDDLVHKKDNIYHFKFELTCSIAFFIKFLFNYFILMREYANILNINIKEAINDHKSIIKKISENWGFNEICFFYFFLPFKLEKKILNIRYLVNEFSLPFIEKNDKFIIENRK